MHLLELILNGGYPYKMRTKEEYKKSLNDFARVFNKKHKTEEDFSNLDNWFDKMAIFDFFEFIKEDLLNEEDEYLWIRLLYLYNKILIDYNEETGNFDLPFIKELIKKNMDDEKRISEIKLMFSSWEPEYVSQVNSELERVRKDNEGKNKT